jgi:WD40 repeat protein
VYLRSPYTHFILLGATLALSTRAPDNKHLLRIYDTRRGLPKSTHLMELEPFPFRDNFEGEVNNASFSPDNMYLALARNDNRTHVYDRRMWDRGVIFEYCHGGDSKAASQKDVYGVVKAQWVQSQATRRMALVTGGEDGKVFFFFQCSYLFLLTVARMYTDVGPLKGCYKSREWASFS